MMSIRHRTYSQRKNKAELSRLPVTKRACGLMAMGIMLAQPRLCLSQTAISRGDSTANASGVSDPYGLDFSGVRTAQDSGFKKFCNTGGTASGCCGGSPRFSLLNHRRWLGIDCLTLDLLDSVSRTGTIGMRDWASVCSELSESEQCGYVPAVTDTETVTGLLCADASGVEVMVSQLRDIKRLQVNHTLACRPGTIVVQKETHPCTPGGPDVCSGESLDMRVFDADLRRDCVARAVRDTIVHGGISEAAALSASCGTRKLATKYNDDCPGAQVRVHSHYVNLFQVKAGVDWHWHLHGNNDGIRGLSFTPLLASLGAQPCQTSACTIVYRKSCWRRPFFKSGPYIQNTLATIYTCLSTDDVDWHFSGQFHGSLSFPGDLSYGGSGGCTATEKDGIVTIVSQGLNWCDIWTDKPPGASVVSESQAKRDVCSAQ